MLQELIKKYPQFEEQLKGGVIPEDVIDAELAEAKEAKREESEVNDMANSMTNNIANNSNYCVGCSNCPYNCGPNQNGKVLCKCNSTSIICNVDLLDNNSGLELVAANRDNRYYHVKGSNSVLLHVEEGFCILVDNMVQTYNSGEEEYSLPRMLSAQHYGVYQSVDGRDWVKGTSSNRAIGHDIQDLVYGNGAKVARGQGQTLDHGAETHNEKLVNCRYKPNNTNNGSHRIKRVLDTKEKLDDYIDAVIAKSENPGYII